MFLKVIKLVFGLVVLVTINFQMLVMSQETKAVSIRVFSTIVHITPKTKKNSRTIFLITAPNTTHNPIMIDTKLISEVSKEWLKKHEENRVVEVFTGSFTSQIRGAYIWVVSNGYSLNVDLVRAGACNAQSMFVDEKDEKKILVRKNEYEEFKRKIYDAESLAKKEELGIWSKAE